MLAERTSEETCATALTRTMGILSSRKLSPDMAASYLRAAEDAYLVFRLPGYAALSAESTPRWHFGDNGILDLFLYNKDSRLLENAVALALLRRYGKDHIFYFKSSKTGIDIDFYIPEASWAIQVCYMLDGSSFERETKSLAELAQDAHLAPERSTIVTLADSERTISSGGTEIEASALEVPAPRIVFCRKGAGSVRFPLPSFLCFPIRGTGCLLLLEELLEPFLVDHEMHDCTDEEKDRRAHMHDACCRSCRLIEAHALSYAHLHEEDAAHERCDQEEHHRKTHAAVELRLGIHAAVCEVARRASNLLVCLHGMHSDRDDQEHA